MWTRHRGPHPCSPAAGACWCIDVGCECWWNEAIAAGSQSAWPCVAWIEWLSAAWQGGSRPEDACQLGWSLGINPPELSVICSPVTTCQLSLNRVDRQWRQSPRLDLWQNTVSTWVAILCRQPLLVWLLVMRFHSVHSLCHLTWEICRKRDGNGDGPRLSCVFDCQRWNSQKKKRRAAIHCYVWWVDVQPKLTLYGH